jgi:hypothetical protein
LDTYELPDFKIYDKTTHMSSGQVPINVASRPANATYFIGIVPNTDPVEKVLCYHISDGKYIVVSYNYSSTKLLQDVLNTDMYETKKVLSYDGENVQYPNPTNIPVINEDMTIE